MQSLVIIIVVMTFFFSHIIFSVLQFFFDFLLHTFFFVEKIHGTKIVVTGDSISRHEKTVVLLNHRTRLDWMFFFSVVFHSKILNRQKIALKSMLKNLPGAGMYMIIYYF